MRVAEIDWEGKTAFLASLRDVTRRKLELQQTHEYARELYQQLRQNLDLTKELERRN